jgi:RHS repeat-associated protein
MGFNPRRRLAYQRWTFFGFTGEMRDPNGLNYHRARYYDPGIGTFTALDPFEGMMDRAMRWVMVCEAGAACQRPYAGGWLTRFWEAVHQSPMGLVARSS